MTIRKNSNNRKEIVQNKTHTIKKYVQLSTCRKKLLLMFTVAAFIFSFFCLVFLLYLVDSTCVCALGQTAALQQLYRKRKEDPKGRFGSSCALRNKQANKPEKKKGQDKKLPDLRLLQPCRRSTPAAATRPLTPSFLLKSRPAAW